MTFVSIAIFTFMLFFTPQVSAESSDYRVAGVVGQKESRTFAIVESPDGSNAIYSRGSLLGDMQILDIVENGIIVEKNGERLLLPLRSGKFVVAKSSSADPAPERLRVATLSLRHEEILKSLESIMEQVSTGKELSAASLNDVLGLPEKSRITSVNGLSMRSPASALTVIHEALAQKTIPHLLIADVAGLEEIYLTPEEE